MKNIGKIRKLLGNRYHLSVEYNVENCEKIHWVLFKKYDNCDPIYWSLDNKPIMNSDDNTEEELYEFVKKHKKIDIENINRQIRTILIYLVLLLFLINVFFINSKIITTIVLTSDAIFLLLMIIDFIMFNKNHKVDMLEITENIKRFGNTIITENLYNSLGEKKILDDLKAHGFNCEIVIYENIDSDSVGRKNYKEKDIIVQVVEGKFK